MGKAHDDEGTGRYSVAFPPQHWYPAARATDLGRTPLAIELFGRPIVLFRDSSAAPRALVDRCPHRNVPLSLGRVRNGELECGYHGWRFDGGGTCVEVPGLVGPPDALNRCAGSHAATESDGFIWIWGEQDTEPVGAPFALPNLGAGAGETIFARDLDSTTHAALEQALDVPHTAFLHGGIFRTGARQELTAVRRSLPGGVEVQYLGEPLGFAGLTLPGTKDKTFDHWDRFFLPSIAQIEYRIDGWLRIVNTILHLPLDEFRTRAWYVLRHDSPVPRRVASAIISARGQKILRQDAEMLAAQTRSIRRFGGERYTSTDLDLLGNAIWRLLRQSERQTDVDGADDDEPIGSTVTIRV